jgi:hypothetical protein
VFQALAVSAGVAEELQSGEAALDANRAVVEQAEQQVAKYQDEVARVNAIRLANLAEQQAINEDLEAQVRPLWLIGVEMPSLVARSRSVIPSAFQIARLSALLQEEDKLDGSVLSPVAKNPEDSSHTLLSVHDMSLDGGSMDVEALLHQLSERDAVISSLEAKLGRKM